MNPTSGSAKVEKLLSQFSQMYRNSNFIGEDILPPLKVKEKTGKFAKYGKENLRPYTGQIYRAPGTRAVSIDYSVSQGEYTCRERSAEKLVPDEAMNNTDDPYDAKRDATAVLMDVIWVNQELALSAVLENTSTITQNVTLSGTDQWSDYSNSTPIDDINTGITTVEDANGQTPNSMFMSIEVWRKLKSHPDVREQLKYTGKSGNMNESAFKSFFMELFDVENVFVGNAIYNSADEGQTDVISKVWGKHFWVFYKNPSPTLMRATFGYTFFDVPRVVDTYREEAKLSDVIRQRYSYDQNIMDATLMYLIKNAIA